MPSPPYENARLVSNDKPLGVLRWYIEFYVWDELKKKKLRKRDYSINKHKTRQERLNYAKQRIRDINKLLAMGYVHNPQKKEETKIKIYVNTDRDYSISEAFTYIKPVIKSTLRPASVRSYQLLGQMFVHFCTMAGWKDWKIRSLKQGDVVAFLDWLQATRNIGNNTRNKYMSYLAAIFSLMKERKVLTDNVAHGIKLLRVDEAGNIAYTPDQIQALKVKLQAADQRLWLFVTFLLYGFIRPAEIGRLRVRMIDLQKGEINLPGTITKNRKPRCVRVSPPFRAYIEQLNLQACQPNDYVFGKSLQTGKDPIQQNYASQEHLKIVRELKLGQGYTLYSWKHTGVVIHYKAGVDIKSLQAQIGHQSLEETDTYLKSLNLYENREFEQKSPSV